MLRYSRSLSLSVALLLTFLLPGCSDKITPEGPPPPGEGAVSVSTPDIVLSGTGQRASFTLTTNGNWFIGCVDPQGTPGWFTVSQNSGDAGQNTIEVTTTEENPYPEDRNAFIRIRSGTSVALVTVTQKKPHVIVASKDRAELETEGGDFTIQLQNDESGYTVTIPAQYAHWLTRQTGGSTTERFRATANGTGGSRTGEIVFTDGERADTIRVYQKGTNETFLLEENIYRDWLPGYGVEINVASGVEFTAAVGDIPERWISSVSRTAPGRAPRVDRAYFTVSINVGKNHRSGEITITDVNSKETEQITVTQRPEAALVDYPEGIHTAPAEGETLIARVSREYEYNAAVPPMFAEWLSVGSREDDGFERPWKLPVTIRPNETNYVRTGYVLLESENKTVSDTIRITQLCNPDDRGILTALYESTGGSGWTNNTGWGTDAPLDQWYGITTDGEGRVTAIDLPDNRLSGQIPDYSVDLLERLEKLDLAHNRLTGVSPLIGSLENLRYLDLSDNLLSGQMPDEWLELITTTINNEVIARQMDLFRIKDNAYSGALPSGFAISNFATNGIHFFDIIKQCGEGFDPWPDMVVFQSLPNVQYTSTKGHNVSLHAFCAENTYNVLYRSTEINEQTIEDLQKLNALSWASIPGYRIGVIWDMVDSGMSADQLEQIRSQYALEFTIVTRTTDNSRDRLKFGDKAEFYLTDGNAKVMLFNYGIDRIYDFLLPQDLYFSQDYSMDKTCRIVQTATVGDGVDIVFTGDGFTDVDVQNGTFDRYADAFFEGLFAIEPFKSLRNRFNLYVVYAVSRNNDYDHPSAYTVFGAEPKSTEAEMRVKLHAYDMWPVYLSSAPVRSVEDATLMIAVNYPSSHGTAIGNVGYSALQFSMDRFKGTMVHELGHAYARLADEYVSFEGDMPQASIDTYKLYWNQYGHYANIDFTDDPAQAKWKHFIGHPKYPYVGVYEGCIHKTGVYRPEEMSIMGNSTYPYFNAPSREAIYKRTVTLGGETYSFEKFVEQDNVTPP